MTILNLTKSDRNHCLIRTHLVDVTILDVSTHAINVTMIDTVPRSATSSVSVKRTMYAICADSSVVISISKFVVLALQSLVLEQKVTLARKYPIAFGISL